MYHHCSFYNGDNSSCKLIYENLLNPKCQELKLYNIFNHDKWRKQEEDQIVLNKSLNSHATENDTIKYKKEPRNWCGAGKKKEFFVTVLHLVVSSPFEHVLIHSDHVCFLERSPSVLEVDICPIFEGVICLYLTPVALSEFFDPFLQLICLALGPLLQHNRNMWLVVDFCCSDSNASFSLCQCCVAIQKQQQQKNPTKIEKVACVVLSPAAGIMWHWRITRWLQSADFLNARSDQIHVILSTSMFAERLFTISLNLAKDN